MQLSYQCFMRMRKVGITLSVFKIQKSCTHFLCYITGLTQHRLLIPCKTDVKRCKTYNTILASCSNKLLSELIGCSGFISCTGKMLMHEQVPINLLFQSIRKAFDGCKVTWASGFFRHLYEAVQGNREVWHQLFRVSFLVTAIYAVGTHTQSVWHCSTKKTRRFGLL